MEIERFTTGMITADANSVELAETTITTWTARAEAVGDAAVQRHPMAFVDGGPVDIQAELIRPDLDILRLSPAC